MSKRDDLGLAVVRWAEDMFRWHETHDPERLNRPGWKMGRELVADYLAVLDEESAQLSDVDANTSGLARSTSHPTDRKAAWEITPKTGTVRRSVLDLLVASADGLTHPELEALMEGKSSPSSVRTRCSELVEGGWVEDSGSTRPTISGQDAIVWVVTSLGRHRLGIG